MVVTKQSLSEIRSITKLTKGEKLLFKSFIFEVVEKKVRINNREHTLHVLVTPPTSKILVIHKNKLVLIKQDRPKVKDGKAFIEAPGGAIGQHAIETPIQNARKELLEETGLKAKNMIPLGPVCVKDTGQGPGNVHYFLATGITDKGVQKLEEMEESIKVVRISLDKAVKMVQNGEINELMTAYAILYYKQFGHMLRKNPKVSHMRVARH